MASTPPAKRAKTSENDNIKLFRSYSYDEIPNIAFYGTSKDEIKPYIKDKMKQERTHSPSYYEFKLNKDDYKLLDLSSEEGQDLLKTLFKENENIMKKAFLLEEDKYIRKSDDKGDDEEAFKLIRNKLSEDKSKSYVGTMTLPSVRLSHSEIVIFNKDLIAELNSEAELKTDIVVTPKVIRKQRRSRQLGNNTSKKTLSFNNSSESETENVEELQPLSLNFPSLLDNTQDNIEGSPVKERQSRKSNFSGVAKKLFGGGKRISVKKSKNQKKSKRNNSTKKRRRTKKKKATKN